MATPVPEIPVLAPEVPEPVPVPEPEPVPVPGPEPIPEPVPEPVPETTQEEIIYVPIATTFPSSSYSIPSW